MKNIELRNIIREEIKKVLKEDNLTQQGLITLFNKKAKNKELMIFLKHSGKHRSLELVIHDEDQLTSNKTYGHGTNQDGHEVEFKFSDVSKASII